MKAPVLISVVVSSVLLMSFTNKHQKSEDCVKTMTSVVHKDTASGVLEYMCAPITQSTSNCSIYTLDITNREGELQSVDYQNVYSLRFYHKNSQPLKVWLAFASLDENENEVWTDSTLVEVEPSNGSYYTFPLSVLGQKSGTNVNKITKTMIITETTGDYLLDEFQLSYYELTQREIAMEEMEKKAKKEKKNFKEKKEKERRIRWYQDRGNIRRDQ